MTKPESDSNEADWLLWHTALIVLWAHSKTCAMMHEKRKTGKNMK